MDDYLKIGWKVFCGIHTSVRQDKLLKLLLRFQKCIILAHYLLNQIRSDN